MFINVSLLVMGVLAFSLCCLRGEKLRYADQINRYVFYMGVFILLWCSGYALMGFQTDYSFAFIFRNVGLLGVLGFMLIETMFLIKISGAYKKHRRLIYIIICLLFAADYILFSNHKVLEFTRVGDRTCYYAETTFARSFHGVFLVALLLFMAWVGYIWYRKTVMRREKKMVLFMYMVNIGIAASSVPDTFFPLYGLPSLPTSAVGAFIASLLIGYVASSYNAYNLSVQNLGTYIYRYVGVPVLVFSYENKVAMVNDYGHEFLNIDLKNQESIELSDVFEISAEDSKEIFSDIYDSRKEATGYRLVSLNNRKLCELNFTVIRDSYQEIYCTICVVTDLSNEVLKMEQLNLERKNLESELREKTMEVEKITLQSIAAIANTIDAKDEYTKGHSLRVSDYSELIARELGWSEEEVQNLRYVALLHDIGKIGVPDAVLNKPGRLTPVEYRIIQSHTTIGAEILKDIVVIRHAAEVAHYHHEKYDGSGYPEGLAGKDIPVMARVVCVADAYDAMSTNRVYRNKLDNNAIIKEMLRCSGTQFDPEILDVFIRLLNENRLVIRKESESPAGSFVDESNKLLLRIMDEKEKKTIKSEQIDYLTQLLNRREGEQRIIHRLSETGGCLALIDMDNLKHVNDVYGHLMGDYALKTLAEVLTEHGENAIIARYGGDEFLFYVNNTDKREIQKIMEGLLYSYKRRKEEHEALAVTSMSIGLCICERQSAYEGAITNADRALYHVKQTGKSGYSFYTDSYEKKGQQSSVDLSRLVAVIKSQGEYKGAMDVEIREFSKIADFIDNLSKRYDYTIQLVMITAGLEEENPDTTRQEELMDKMGMAIRNSLRNVDITTRFSSDQYLVILVNAEDTDVEIIIKRILKKFYKSYAGTTADINYDWRKLNLEP